MIFAMRIVPEANLERFGRDSAGGWRSPHRSMTSRKGAGRRIYRKGFTGKDLQERIYRKGFTGKEEEPSKLIYFKKYKSDIPVIEQAIDTAALMLGTDKSRGYCQE